QIQFPDRVVVQATFGCKEGVKDVIHLVKDCLGEEYQGRQFQLYVSPPRTLLKEASSLSDAGLVPAALVYVSWTLVPPSGEAEGAYLKTELSGNPGGSGAALSRPVGVALVPGQPDAQEGARGRGGGRLGGGAGVSGSMGSGNKRKGKPSWLKIN
ncbi:unnamed protein product, partial [Sphacelaria rigidula]